MNLNSPSRSEGWVVDSWVTVSSLIFNSEGTVSEVDAIRPDAVALDSPSEIAGCAGCACSFPPLMKK